MSKFIDDISGAVARIFHIPTAEVLAVRELEQAKRQLLEMQTAKDYSTRMVEYNQDRIRRLNAYIAKAAGDSNDKG